VPPVLMFIIDVATYIMAGIAFYRLANLANLREIAWFSWVPILNIILMLKLIGKNGWWILMLLVPIANLVFIIIWYIQLFQAFGKYGAWVLMQIFLPIVSSVLWVVWAYDPNTRYQLPY
jgi:hypothetical protein